MNVVTHAPEEQNCHWGGIPAISIENSSTISEFCHRHQMGRTTYFKLRKLGLAPKEIRAGRLVRIGADAERNWIAQRQAAAE